MAFGRGQGRRGGGRGMGMGRGYGYAYSGRQYGGAYSPGYGMGLGRGRYSGRGNPLPYCRWNPSLPRGWWRDPNYQQNVAGNQWAANPNYVNSDAIDYQINLIADQIKFLEKEIDRLKSLKKRY
ncbi:MAG: hypothetical protein ACTSYD_06735 [Candidatus Heimdallarchaeaceae archaeon]